jgi:hypothetical protein
MQLTLFDLKNGVDKNGSVVISGRLGADASAVGCVVEEDGRNNWQEQLASSDHEIQT